MAKSKSNSEIDYSNTIIYKITCKDAGVQELYVGHTTNFVQRKQAHKYSCMNPKSTNHTCKLYAIIREHGGWKNWIMEIIHFFNCNNLCEARTKEQEYFILLNATLNSIEPMPSGKPLAKHKEPVKLLPDVIEPTNVAYKFYCINCNYGTCKKSNYDMHNLSAKHSKNKKIKPNTISRYVCDFCDKTYNDRAGLWRHKKKCDNINSEKTSNTIHDASNNCVIDKELVMLLIKENSELKNMILEEHKSTKQIMMDTQNQIAEVLKIFTHNQ
jgi:hypothetical protein